MIEARPWQRPEYQRIVDAEYRKGHLTVSFEDGARVRVRAERLLSPEADEPRWSELTFNPYEILVPTPEQELEIPWSTIRVLTDRAYAAHLAAAEEDQARWIGRRLRELRRSRGLTGKEVAARAGISPQSLSRIENGRHDVVLTTLRRILAAMGYSLRDLAGAAERSQASWPLSKESVER